MNVWLVNPFDFLPYESYRKGRYTFVVNALLAKGHHVTWWTSNFLHASKQHRSPGYCIKKINDNFEIRLLATPGYGQNISLKRIYNHHIYCRQFMKYAAAAETKPDIILASMPPLGSAVAAIRLGRAFKAKVIIDIIDIWPEVFLFLVPKRFRTILKALMLPLFKRADTIYNDADAIMAVSDTYLARAMNVCRQAKPGLTLHLGVDLDHFQDHTAGETAGQEKYEKKDGDVWITYIGTLGKTYDLDTVLTAAKAFLGDEKIKFMIAGQGPEFNRLVERAVKEKIRNVHFTGLLDYVNLIALLKKSDIGLNAYAPDAPQSFPTKIFDYFAAGLPVVNSLEGELHRLIAEKKVGVYYRAGHAGSLTAALKAILSDERERLAMGNRAYSLAAERFNSRKEYDKLIILLQDIKGNEQASSQFQGIN